MQFKARSLQVTGMGFNTSHESWSPVPAKRGLFRRQWRDWAQFSPISLPAQAALSSQAGGGRHMPLAATWGLQLQRNTQESNSLLHPLHSACLVVGLIRFTHHCLAPQKDDLNFLSQIFYAYSWTYSHQRRDRKNTGQQMTAAYFNSAGSGSRDEHDGRARGIKVRGKSWESPLPGPLGRPPPGQPQRRTATEGSPALGSFLRSCLHSAQGGTWRTQAPRKTAQRAQPPGTNYSDLHFWSDKIREIHA